MTKNYFISMQKGFLALMSAALLFSCSQIEPFEMEGDISLRSVGITGTGGGDCKDDCIDPENPVYSVQTASISDGDSRRFEYKVYNTLTGFELDWIYSASNQGSRQLRITVSGAGFSSSKTYTSNTVQGSGNGRSTFNFDAAWAACGEVTIRAEILEGVQVRSTQTTTYRLIGACSGCEEFFTYVDNKDGTYTFTYIPDSDIDGAELVFTFAQGIVMEGLEDWSTNGQTKQKVMNLKSCEEISWIVTLACESNPGAQNLWTDFKVNNVSKKGTLQNIKCN